MRGLFFFIEPFLPMLSYAAAPLVILYLAKPVFRQALPLGYTSLAIAVEAFVANFYMAWKNYALQASSTSWPYFFVAHLIVGFMGVAMTVMLFAEPRSSQNGTARSI